MNVGSITIPSLAKAVAENTGGSIENTANTIRVLVDVMAYHLRERGERIYLNGLGVFEVRHLKPKGHASPMTKGKRIIIPARRHVRFSPAKGLRNLPLHEQRPEPQPSAIDQCPFL